MLRRCAPLVGLLIACLLVLTASTGFAADWDHFPELEPHQHVAIKRRFDGPLYRDLKNCYRRFDSRVGADYYGAMVDVTAENGSHSRKYSDAGPYAAALYKAWKQAGKLHGDDDIVIVLGLRNRSIAIHPGPKWQKLGFEGKVIDDTIDASHFYKLRRRRNYVDAMCTLANAVDLRLASLQQQMKERVARLAKRLPALDQKLTALTNRVDDRFDGDHPYGDKLLARLAAARTKLDEAKAHMKDKPRHAVHLADQVEAVLQPVRSDLETFNADMARLDTLEKDLTTLEAKIKKRPDVGWKDPQAALVKLAECKALAKKIRQDYDGKPWQVRDCQRKAEIDLGRADVRYAYLHTILPTLATVLVIALLIAFVLARIFRRRRALRALQPELAEWRRRIDHASKRLDAIVKQCPAYFAPGRRPWRGESAEVDQKVAQAVERMSRLLALARGRLSEAEALRQKSHPLDPKRLEKALLALREAVPDTAHLGPASELLGDLDDAYLAAREHLDEVSDIHRRLAEQASTANEAATRATRGAEQRRQLGLPAEHLTAPLQAAMDAWNQAQRLSASDPKRAAAILERAGAQLDDIATRAATGNEAVRRVQGPLAELGEELNQTTRKLRFARLDTDKLSFDPERELDAAKRQAVHVVELVADADEDAAGAEVDALQTALDRLAARLEVVALARDGVPQRLEQLTARSKALKERLIEMRYNLRSLTSDGDADAFALEATRLGQYHARLNRLSKLVANAKKDHAAGRYLLANERVDALERLFADAESLLGDLQGIEQTVDEARGQCRHIVHSCEPILRELQARAKKAGIDPALRKLVAEQAVSFQMLRDQVGADQASWLDARDELTSLQQVVAFVDEEVGADLDAYDQARELAAELGAELGALAATTAEARDIIGRARQMLTDWNAQLDEGTGGGRALLRTGRAVEKTCARAADAATGHTPLAIVVASQLAYAHQRYAEIHDVDYGYGIHADCSHVDDEFDAADAALQAGDHARALALSESVLEQLDLEDARADAEAERAYRKVRVQVMTHQVARPDFAGAVDLGSPSSWAESVATLDQHSKAATTH